MTSIPARLAAAIGPDRELDYAIAEWAFPYLSNNYYQRIAGDEGWFCPNSIVPGGMRIARAAAFTHSIDAAIALVEHMRGDRPAEWSHSIMQTAVEMAWRRFVDDGGAWTTWLPIALLKALFAALAKPGPGAVG